MTISLKMFLVYIGAFLVASIAGMMAVKGISPTFANNGKRPWIFNFGTSALASGAIFGTTWVTPDSFTLFWIFAGIFLLSGFIFVLLIHKKYFKAKKDNKNKQFLAEILYAFSILFLCVTIFSALQYFIKKSDFLFFPVLLSLLFFLIPVLVLYTFNAAYEIPKPVYDAWQYPVGVNKDIPDEDEREHLYVIGFEIAKKPSDVRRTYFRAKAPENMQVGDLFYFFINDYNEQYSETPIEYTGENEVHHWYFRKKPKWYQSSRILKWDRSVRENKIKENSVIICERT